MAIIIPSKNIYEIQNPKVRDNVIDRIEIEAVNIVPDNEYDVPVYNEKIFATNNNVVSTAIENSVANGTQFAISGGDYTNSRRSASFVGYVEQKSLIAQIRIPIVKNNKAIDKIITGVNKEGEDNIKYSLYGVEKKGNCSANWYYKAPSTALQITIGAISYEDPTETSNTKILTIPREISIIENSDNQNQVGSSAKQELKKWGNLSTTQEILQTIDGEDYYILDLQIPCGVKTVGMTHFDNLSTPSSSHTPPTTLSFSGSYTIYEANEIEITIYGNTIGIDLKEKTIYVNGQTQKRVQSFEGNELMQTDALVQYSVYEPQPLLETLYGETQNKYRSGKETATILCAIDDYYNTRDVLEVVANSNDLDISLFNVSATFGIIFVSTDKEYMYDINFIAKCTYISGIGERITVVKSLTIPKWNKQASVTAFPLGTQVERVWIESAHFVDAPMTFKIGDKVIPMVYERKNKDRPMSLFLTLTDTYQKIFEVIGRELYYDGSVKQKLYLQEVDKIEYVDNDKSLSQLNDYMLSDIADNTLEEL